MPLQTSLSQDIYGEIKDYKDAITFLAQTKSDKEFLNKGCEHAVVVLKTIFDFADEEILLFAGNNKGEVTNNQEYTDSVENFLNSGKKLKVILENKTESKENEFLLYKIINDFAIKKTEQVQIKYADKGFLEDVKSFFNQGLHFIVGDGSMYRIEINPDDYKAICAFNDKKMSHSLENLFTKHFNRLD